MAESIRIEAPDALLGFLLLQRLPQLDAHVQMGGGSWAVEIETAAGDPEDLFSALLETVRQWLRDEQLARTTAHVGGRTVTVTAERRSD